MILTAALILLFCGWMLWGWLASERRNIAWVRNWCASMFVVTAILISLGAGAAATLVVVKSRHRVQVQQFATVLEQKLAQGRTDVVRKELLRIIQEPDEWSSDSEDLLKRLISASERLSADEGPAGESPAKTAEASLKSPQRKSSSRLR